MNVTRSAPPENAPKSRLTAFPGVLLAVLALAIAISGFVAFEIQQEPLKHEAKQRLGRIADRKVQGVNAWLREQWRDGYAVGRNQFLGDSVARWLESGARPDATRDRIEQYFSELITAHTYDGLVLFDRHGEPKLAIGPHAEVSAKDRARAAEAFRSSQISQSDFEVVKSEGESAIVVDLYVPLLAAGRETVGTAAVLMIRTNAPAFIYPQIQEWPVFSASAEALLVRREGDQVAFLTTPRGRKDAPLGLKLPLNRHDLPAAMAVQGKEGEVEGVDYDGVPVVAALRRIPDSPWHLVAKIDAAEAHAPVRELALTFAVIGALAFFGAGAAVLFWWRAQRAHYRAREADAKAERQALVGHFDYLAKFANDSITLADEHGNFVETNDRALSESGYSREEFLRMNARDLLAADDVAKYERTAGGSAPAGRVFETVTRRKDGSTYPVEVSARTIEIEGRSFSQYIARDISERRRAEEALRESEATLRMIASSAPDAILMLDNDGNISLWNAAAERMFGYSSAEALGMNLHDLLAPERFHEAHRIGFEHFRSSGEGAAIGKPLELAALRKDGTEFPIELSISAVKLKDKWCAIGIVRDIGERKKSEEHLRASEERHRSLLAAMAEGVVLQDANGAIVMFNERAERLLGLTSAQFTGGLPIDPRWRAIHEDGSAFPGQEHPSMVTLNTGVPQSDVVMGVHKPDGALTWISINTEALTKPGQTTPDGVVSSFRDITEHRTAEEKLRLANAVIENSPAVLFRWRAAEGWPVEYVSSNVRQFGFTAEELLTGAVPFARMVYPEDLERVAAEVARYTAGGSERFAQEYRVVTRDGAVRWVDDRTTIERDANGDARYYQGVLTDITGKKQAEMTLKHSEERYRTVANFTYDWEEWALPDGSLAYVSPSCERISGYQAQEFLQDPGLRAKIVHPDDRERVQAHLNSIHGIPTGPDVEELDFRIVTRHGEVRWIAHACRQVLGDNGEYLGRRASNRDITERKRAEEDHLAHLRFMESMDQINRAIQGTNNLEKMMSDVLDAMLEIFDCDRAWLLYPCDPDASSWTVPMERTKPEYPGASVQGLLIPMDPEVQRMFRIQRGADSAVSWGPGSDYLYPEWLTEQFGVQSQLSVSTYPKQGKPWQFGMHQCSHARTWQPEEKRLFQEISRRLADALSSLLMQRDLRQSEEFLDAIVENIPDMIFVKDAQALRFVRFNSAGERLLGYPREELLGKNDYDFFPKEEADSFTARDREVLAGKGLVDIPEEAIKTRVQGERFLHTKKIPIADKEGEPQYLLGISEDITEHKRAEDTLRMSEEKYRTIFEESFDGLFVTSPEGRILDMNKKGVAMFGYDTKEEIQRLDLERDVYAHPPDRKRILAMVDAQGTAEYEVEVKKKTGEAMVTRCALTAVRDKGGSVVSYRGIISDITEKKRAERALHKVNRALKATSACNMALIHATDEPQLLNEICQIIVESGGYRLAWVGYAEHDPAKTVRPVAQSGYEPGYMEHTHISWADDELGNGPLGLAIRCGQIQVVQDVNTDPRFEPWRANAARLGYGSVMVAPLLSDSETIGALSIYAADTDAFDAAEIALLGELAADMAFGIVTLRARGAHEQSAERLQRSMEATIQVIAGTVEMRDPYTAGHQIRVAELAAAIAREMGLTEDQVHGIRLAGLVHDLGKIQIPAEILSKPGKLSRIEFEMIKTHPEAGYDILKDVDFPWPIAQIVFQHHERLDGSGYPRGLQTNEILLEARIMAVADVVEAMASHRPYRPSLGIERALEEISANAGKYYDADAVRACILLLREKAFAFTT
ncbi:MAG: hypothetical protein FD157_2530 [Rhodocyclaceae bacterium]|nr:MAG: hypothetical protein FD157_2530 [Rhodocyclaceae bacterium]TND00153.1 MAG: hypothetical protein FD118_3337 [Rhodocyclaceae bacterium]